MKNPKKPQRKQRLKPMASKEDKSQLSPSDRSGEPNDKQKLFIDYYLEDPSNQANAYLKVYPDSSKESAGVAACRLLKNTRIQKYIETRKAEASQLRAENIIGNREAIQRRMLHLSKVAEQKGQISSAIRALELIGRETGLYAERLKHSGDEEDATPINVAVTGQINLNALSVAELKELKRIAVKAQKKDD